MVRPSIPILFFGDSEACERSERRITLEQGGVTLWHRVIEHLQPQVILISLAARHLSKNRFAPLGDWHTIYKLERRNPYEFRHRIVRVGSGERMHLVFGKAAQKPFGTVSCADKFNAGQFLAERLLGAARSTA